jgi:hypothetical protein
MWKLIKPTYKDKLGINLSYPIGTQIISEILQGISQFDSLSVHYRKDEGPWLGNSSPMRRLERLKGDTKDLYPFNSVATTYYSIHSDHWSIVIYRTLSKQNKQVSNFLISRGLPLVRIWLAEDRNETWYSGTRYFEIGLNKSMDKYCVRETHNDRLVYKLIDDFQAYEPTPTPPTPSSIK